MHTETRPPRGQDGFTLIEVLVALLILAVGLLGLEALGIGAARSVAMADRQSDYAALAASALEDAMEQLRADVVPDEYCEDAPFGASLSRRVDLSNPNRPVVVVRVAPDAEDAATAVQPFEIRSSLYSPTAFTGTANGTPCS